MNLEKCVWLDIANKQKIKEVERGEELRGTKSYILMGCYKCKGYNKNCQYYQPEEKQWMQ